MKPPFKDPLLNTPHLKPFRKASHKDRNKQPVRPNQEAHSNIQSCKPQQGERDRTIRIQTPRKKEGNRTRAWDHQTDEGNARPLPRPTPQPAAIWAPRPGREKEREIGLGNREELSISEKWRRIRIPSPPPPPPLLLSAYFALENGFRPPWSSFLALERERESGGFEEAGKSRELAGCRLAVAAPLSLSRFLHTPSTSPSFAIYSSPSLLLLTCINK